MNNLTLIWLDRFGIILNFIAGFCLAPELIGVERLQRLEDRIETYLHDLEAQLHPVLEKIQEFFKSKDWAPINFTRMTNTGITLMTVPVIFFIISISIPIILYVAGDGLYRFSLTTPPMPIVELVVLSIVIIIFVGILIVLDLGLFTFFMFIGKVVPNNSTESSNNRTNRLKRGITSTFEFSFALVLIPLLFKVESFINSLIQNFKERKQIQSFLVWIGIICFVIGNLLQLIATF